MPILAIAVVVLLIVVAFSPNWWIRRVLAKHGVDRPDLPGTGGEFARHLLDEVALQDVKVEVTDAGDHYDPGGKAVRLLPAHHDGRSVAAVAVAAHEVSHAIQHSRNERAFNARMTLLKQLVWVERIATAVVLLAPVMFILVRSPALIILQVLCGLALMAIGIVVHVVTLPVEFDASFGKALPILEERGYLSSRDMPAARSVLSAAAYTYVAAALSDLLNIARWFRVFRF